MTALLVASAGGANLSFKRQMASEVDTLFAESDPAASSLITEPDLAGLPAPVQRWLLASGVVGRERPFAVRLKQEGEFRLGEDRDWMPYRAEQYFTTNPPGFIWIASFEMAPHVSISGRDRYQAGVGNIEMRLLGIIPVASKRGGGLNQGALHRYLGEIVWFPAVALDPSIRWKALDDSSALATMSSGGETVSATFVFDDQGRLVSLSADRYNDDRGRIEPWSISIAEYGAFGSIEIPVAGEGVWHDETGDFTYIRWRIIDLEQNVPEAY
jgi:hypothetical protein